MKEQKFLIIDFDVTGQRTVEDLLSNGWLIKSMVQEFVALGGGSFPQSEKGKLAIAFEREK